MLSLSSMLFVGHQKLKRGRPWGWQGLLWGRNARTDLGCPDDVVLYSECPRQVGRSGWLRLQRAEPPICEPITA